MILVGVLPTPQILLLTLKSVALPVHHMRIFLSFWTMLFVPHKHHPLHGVSYYCSHLEQATLFYYRLLWLLNYYFPSGPEGSPSRVSLAWPPPSVTVLGAVPKGLDQACEDGKAHSGSPFQGAVIQGRGTCGSRTVRQVVTLHPVKKCTAVDVRASIPQLASPCDSVQDPRPQNGTAHN